MSSRATTRKPPSTTGPINQEKFYFGHLSTFSLYFIPPSTFSLPIYKMGVIKSFLSLYKITIRNKWFKRLYNMLAEERENVT